MMRWNIRSLRTRLATAMIQTRKRQIRRRWPVPQGHRRRAMLIVEELDRLFVDLHVLAVGDGRRLGRAHEMAPAPRKAGGVELLEGGVRVLEGGDLGEVVGSDVRVRRAVK